MGQVGPQMGQVGPQMGQVGPQMGQVGLQMGQVGPKQSTWEERYLYFYVQIWQSIFLTNDDSQTNYS